MKDKLIALYRYTYRSSPPIESNRKMLWFCFFVGVFGVHRYFMGYKLWWLMFLTMGGLGLWSLLDLWRLYVRRFPMADGTPLHE